MKDFICAAAGVIGAAAAALFGGWTAGLTTLVVCMSVDYMTGLLVAGVFHASDKTPTGGLESRAGWKGLVRKAVTLLLVLIAGRLELLLGVTYVRDAAVIGFCANELLSITENAVLMGVPVPAAVAEAMELLRRRGDNGDRGADAFQKSLPPTGGDFAEAPPVADAARRNRGWPLPVATDGSERQPGRRCAVAPQGPDEGQISPGEEVPSRD